MCRFVLPGVCGMCVRACVRACVHVVHIHAVSAVYHARLCGWYMCMLTCLGDHHKAPQGACTCTCHMYIHVTTMRVLARHARPPASARATEPGGTCTHAIPPRAHACHPPRAHACHPPRAHAGIPTGLGTSRRAWCRRRRRIEALQQPTEPWPLAPGPCTPLLQPPAERWPLALGVMRRSVGRRVRIRRPLEPPGCTFSLSPWLRGGGGGCGGGGGGCGRGGSGGGGGGGGGGWGRRGDGGGGGSGGERGCGATGRRGGSRGTVRRGIQGA